VVRVSRESDLTAVGGVAITIGKARLTSDATCPVDTARNAVGRATLLSTAPAVEHVGPDRRLAAGARRAVGEALRTAVLAGPFVAAGLLDPGMRGTVVGTGSAVSRRRAEVGAGGPARNLGGSTARRDARTIDARVARLTRSAAGSAVRCVHHQVGLTAIGGLTVAVGEGAEACELALTRTTAHVSLVRRTDHPATSAVGRVVGQCATDSVATTLARPADEAAGPTTRLVVHDLCTAPAAARLLTAADDATRSAVLSVAGELGASPVTASLAQRAQVAAGAAVRIVVSRVDARPCAAALAGGARISTPAAVGFVARAIDAHAVTAHLAAPTAPTEAANLTRVWVTDLVRPGFSEWTGADSVLARLPWHAPLARTGIAGIGGETVGCDEIGRILRDIDGKAVVRQDGHDFEAAIPSAVAFGAAVFISVTVAVVDARLEMRRVEIRAE